MPAGRPRMNDLPLVKRRGYWHISQTINGQRIRQTTGCKDAADAVNYYMQEFLPRYESVIKKGEKERQRRAERTLGALKPIADDWKTHIEDVQNKKNGWLWILFRNARGRAARIKKPFSLTYQIMIDLALQTNGRCEVTGIPFSFQEVEGAQKLPFQPSLDRIDNALGYSYGNCRLVCYAVNVALNDWGLEVLERIAEALCKGQK